MESTSSATANPADRTGTGAATIAGPGVGQRAGSRSLGARIAAAVRAARAASVERKFLTVLLLLFFAKGIILTFVHAPYSGHDEVAHYTYLRYVAEEQRIPVIPDLSEWRTTYETARTYDHDRLPPEFWKYCRFTTADWGAGCGGVRASPSPVYAATLPPRGDAIPMGWVYTANHPPLYYLVMTPVYWLSSGQSIEGQLYILRLAAIPFGLLTVLFAYLTARTLFPRDQFLAMMVPAFVAFQPQIAYEAAMLNNDILAICFTSALVSLLALGLKQRFPLRVCLWIGFSFGLAMLAKNTSAVSAPVIAFAMIFGLGVRRWREWLPKGALTALVAALLVWPWFLYMDRTYGDFTALGRIRELQYWNYGRGNSPTIWELLSSRNFVWSRWHETWGAFGWRLNYLSSDLMRIILWVTLVGTVGIGVWAYRFWTVQKPILREDDPARAAALRARAESVFDLQRWQVVGILTMGVTCLVSYYAILQFGTTFSLTQARYYFPAIVPAAILLMLGFRALFPESWLPYVQTALFAGMIAMTVTIYTAYVLPYWATADKRYTDILPFYR